MKIRTSLSAFVAVAVAAWPAVSGAAPIGAYTTKGAWSFVSAPGLHPPKLRTDAPTISRDLAPGDFLVANFPNVGASGPMTGQSGPLILNNRLEPVWLAPVPTNVVAANLQQESYNGQPVLVYWQGVVTRTGVTVKGEDVVVDEHYRRLAAVKARSPWVISLHDAQISGSTMFVTVYRNVSGQDLRAFHGPRNGTVLDSGVQAYNLKTGKLLYTWDALNPGHRTNIPLSESRQPVPAHGAWDAYHINAVEPVSDGQLLVSLRNTWGAYRIDPRKGRIIWTLGGRHSSFKGAANTRFAWQHDVQLLAGGEVTMFNDNCCGIGSNGEFMNPSGISSGLVLRLNQKAHAVSLVKAYSTHKRTTAFLGSMELLPDGNALVGYGSLPFLSEFSASGRLLLDAVFPGKDQSYRARYSETWLGTPSYPPSGAVRRKGSSTTVYASWNGATQVNRWDVLAGTSAATLTRVASKPKSGFETAIAIPSSADTVFQVVAFDPAAHQLGASKPFSLH
jgi:hypothetical protein